MRYNGGVLGISSSRGVEEPSSFTPLKQYVTAVVGVAALTIGCWLLTPLTGYAAISLIYLLGVLLAGMILGRGPVLLVATLSAISWNFLFIPPRFTLHIDKLEDALTFIMYFVIALTVGGLTAQLKARGHLAAQGQLAKNSERLRKTLLDCVSHELKTPLAAIGAASQELLLLAAETQNNPMLKELAGEIHDGSHRLNRVVNNLLDMNRLESGVIRPSCEWCDVRDLLQSAIEIECESIDGREVRIDVSEQIPLALVDHTLIEQAGAKRLAHAGRHTPSRVTIQIEA